MTFNHLERGKFSVSKWLYQLFLNFFIYPSIWVAAGIASLGMFTQRVLELGDNWQPIAFIFVTALIPYNLDRIFDSYIQEIPEAQAQLFFRKPYIFVLLFSAIAATAALLYYAPLRVRYVSFAGIIPLVYGTPLFPWKTKSGLHWYRLKDIPGSKAWIVGSTLTYAVIALPLAYAGAKFNLVAAFTTLFMFVFIVSNAHVFDIRDIESDREKGVVTLPIMVGIKGTKTLLTTINLLMLLIIISAWITDTMTFHPEIILATAVTISYIWAVKAETPRSVYSIWIEGCLFVPLLANWAIATIF
ncbi:UbiA family prenyltransferase [Plectonema cf. radiosum LEGE 06105]|uniref:UbiA family prenyltransferase n=1 Tax=Plectonema cf. radiosum LEGE 06105 TaxID=945769 RepID=A0A8J7F6F3_9CYAN|nr:UbiA family prenyltransferase [Plectonema radiosum]MBE9212284.1 UbiA family prenyltransferase [Plectonema cf. radiosum LEGE 06105]